MFFEGFGPPETIPVTGGELRVRRAGTGPALLLLHGHPQTHAMWHAVAPRLANRFTVICADLPGYGGSLRHQASDAEAGTGRAMTARLLEAMTALGIERFGLAGHDRGGRVAHRVALQAPERVRALAVLDIVPVPAPVERADMAAALATYRMFWFAQTHPKPEALFPSVPGDWFAGTLPGDEQRSVFHAQAVEDYVATVADTEAMAALDAAYRRAAELDTMLDRMDHAGERRVACPTLVLWGAAGSIGGWYDPVSLWSEYVAGPVSGRAIEAGHFLAEEQPALVAELLGEFFGGGMSAAGDRIAYKVLTAAEHAELEADRVFGGSAIDRADGFIHLSTEAQLAGTLDRHFAGRSGLVVAAVDLAMLGAAVRWEPSRGGALFPHIHGTLPIEAVFAAAPLARRDDGSVVLPGPA